MTNKLNGIIRDYESWESTVPIRLGRSRKTRTGLEQLRLTRPYVSHGYNSHSYPVVLHYGHVAELWKALDRAQYTLSASIPVDRQHNRFFLPRNLTTFTKVVRHALSQIEALVPLKNIVEVQLISVAREVRWRDSLLNAKWHRDNTLDRSENPKKTEHGAIRMSCAYPFETQFAVSNAARTSRGSLKITNATTLRPPRRAQGHFLAWNMHHIHRSPPMPENPYQAQRLLEKQKMKLPRKMMTDDGMIRVYVELTAIYRLPTVKRSSSKPFRREVHHRL